MHPPPPPWAEQGPFPWACRLCMGRGWCSGFQGGEVLCHLSPPVVEPEAGKGSFSRLSSPATRPCVSRGVPAPGPAAGQSWTAADKESRHGLPGRGGGPRAALPARAGSGRSMSWRAVADRAEPEAGVPDSLGARNGFCIFKGLLKKGERERERQRPYVACRA